MARLCDYNRTAGFESPLGCCRHSARLSTVSDSTHITHPSCQQHSTRIIRTAAPRANQVLLDTTNLQSCKTMCSSCKTCSIRLRWRKNRCARCQGSFSSSHFHSYSSNVRVQLELVSMISNECSPWQERLQVRFDWCTAIRTGRSATIISRKLSVTLLFANQQVCICVCAGVDWSCN